MILVVAEQRQRQAAPRVVGGRGGGAGAGRRSARRGVVLGASPAEAAAELSQAAVGAVHVIDVARCSNPYTPDGYADALQQAIASSSPSTSSCRTRIARATSRRSLRRASIGRSSPTASASTRGDRPYVPSPRLSGQADGRSGGGRGCSAFHQRADRRVPRRQRRRADPQPRR